MLQLFHKATASRQQNTFLYFKILLLAFALYLALVLSATEATQEIQEEAQTKQAILVLDASGSMWGKIDERHKIEIAREVVSKTVKNWDSGIEMGLMAYGHRRKGDCSDIELLIPPKALDAKQFITQANNLNPTGKTPLSAAVTQAAELLDYKNTKATVILVSDGKETCNLDPCAVGNALEKAGLDFTAHIIGFDVPKEDTLGMQCLAENTGGIFIEASNSNELEEALKDTTDVLTEEVELDLSPATISFENPVVAGAKFNVEWTGPQNKNDVLTVLTSERESAGNGTTNLSIHDFKTPIALNAPEKAGDYIVAYKASNHQILGEGRLKVVEALASLTPPDTVVAGSRFEVKWSGPKNRYDQIILRNLDDSDSHGITFVDSDDRPNPAILTAPDDAGIYKVELQTKKNNILASAEFEVTAALATLKIAQEEIIAYNMDETKYSIGRYSSNRTRVHVKQDTNISKINVPEIAGDYLVVYRTARDEKVLVSKQIKVLEATGWLRLPASVTPGKQFEFEWGGPENQNDRFKIFSMDEKKRYHGGGANKVERKGVNRGRPTDLIAPKEPGTYIVKLLTAEKRELARATLVVK